MLTCFLAVIGGTAYADLHAFLIHYLYDIIFSKSPSMRVTPTNNTLVAFRAVNAFSAPLLICISPLAETLGVGDPFLYAADGFRGRNESGCRPCRYPPPITSEGYYPFAVGDDNRNTFVCHFLSDMTFRQHTSASKDDLLVCTYSDKSVFPHSISRITELSGSDGSPL